MNLTGWWDFLLKLSVTVRGIPSPPPSLHLNYTAVLNKCPRKELELATNISATHALMLQISLLSEVAYRALVFAFSWRDILKSSSRQQQKQQQITLASNLTNPVKQPSGLSTKTFWKQKHPAFCAAQERTVFLRSFPTMTVVLSVLIAFLCPQIFFSNFDSLMLPFSPDTAGSKRACLNTSENLMIRRIIHLHDICW